MIARTLRRVGQIQHDLIVLPKALDESAPFLIRERPSGAPKDLIGRPRAIDRTKRPVPVRR